MSRVHKLSNSEKAAHAPRIVGGKLRGQSLEFTPSSRTRPMKDRVRETLFDLVGPKVKQTVAIDLFAGTGALGFEALSRGASQAIFAERHFPTADAIVRSARRLGVEDVTTVLPGDVLLWSRGCRRFQKARPGWCLCHRHGASSQNVSKNSWPLLMHSLPKPRLKVCSWLKAVMISTRHTFQEKAGTAEQSLLPSCTESSFPENYWGYVSK